MAHTTDSFAVPRTKVQGIEQTFVNATENCQYGNESCDTLFTNDWKTLFQSLKREYGPLCSNMYIDKIQVNGQMASEHIGYIFKKWVRDEDTNEPYEQEVWVEFIPGDDTRI